MRAVPPKRALKFLRWFCREDYVEEIEGDLVEVFDKKYPASPTGARVSFYLSVLRYLRPGFIRSFNRQISPDMYRNYFTVSWRNLLRQKIYSVIKIGGLSLGIAACCLIALFLRVELSYDQQYPSNVYRIVPVFNDNGNLDKSVACPAPFANAIVNDFPQIESAGRYNASELFGAGNVLIRKADDPTNNYEERLAFVDQSLLRMLNLPMVYGSADHALAEPYSIVITRTISDRYFPNEDPVGKTLIVNNETTPYKIGGVIEDFLPTSHIRFNFLVTMTGKEMWKDEQNDWGASNYPTYVKVRAGTDIKTLEKAITHGIIEKYFLPMIVAESGMTENEVRQMLSKGTLTLQPVRDIYLTTDVSDHLSHGDIRFIWLFAAIAIAILIIACINFINLSTARSSGRAKEVGLRKVMGSLRRDIASQFMIESALFTLLSFAAGILMAVLLLPYFNVLASRSIEFPWTDLRIWLAMIGALIVIAVVAGFYPSVYLSSFQAINVLKGNLGLGRRTPTLRSILVVFQFTTSIALIVSTIIIYRQMNFMLNKDLGFDKEQVLVIQGAQTIGKQETTFKNTLLGLSGVKYVSMSDYLPVSETKRNGNSFDVEGRAKVDKPVIGQFWRVDTDYIKTMGMKLTAGRDFDPKMATDSQAVVINRSLARSLGLTEPVGARIVNGTQPWNVIGVVEDFHFESMKENIAPICLALGGTSDVISVKTTSHDVPSTIEAIADVWKQFAPNQPFRFTFLDQRFAVMYDDVKRMGSIFTAFASLAIIVACLGLFGLSSFLVEQRSKEVSIRLVLGASVSSILQLLTRNFVVLITISFAIAAPLAGYLMQKWLQDYSYQTQITWDIFAVAGLACLIVAMLTVSIQSLRAATAKPAEKLRSE